MQFLGRKKIHFLPAMQVRIMTNAIELDGCI